MNNQNAKQLRLNDYLSYFETENLQITKENDKKLNQFFKLVEELKGFTQMFKNLLNTKFTDFHQTKKLLHDLTIIKNHLKKLETIHNEYYQFFTRISNIVSNTTNLVRKVPYIFDPLKNLRIGGKGTRYAVKWNNPSYIFTINHQVLVDLLINLKEIVKPFQNGNETFQTNPISSLIKKISDIAPSIKDIYFPYVLYIQVPELFDLIINLGKELEVLFNPYIILNKTQFLKENIETTVINFESINEQFVQKPDLKVIKLKGKFKDAYWSLHKLNFFISFKGLTYYRYY